MVVNIVLIVFISLGQKANLNHLKICENKDFCNVAMPSEDTKRLEFNQYCKSGKAPFIIYADLESLIGRFMDVTIILKNHL